MAFKGARLRAATEPPLPGRARAPEWMTQTGSSTDCQAGPSEGGECRGGLPGGGGAHAGLEGGVGRVVGWKGSGSRARTMQGGGQEAMRSPRSHGVVSARAGERPWPASGAGLNSGRTPGGSLSGQERDLPAGPLEPGQRGPGGCGQEGGPRRWCGRALGLAGPRVAAAPPPTPARGSLPRGSRSPAWRAASHGAVGATWWLRVRQNLHHREDLEVLRDPVSSPGPGGPAAPVASTTPASQDPRGRLQTCLWSGGPSSLGGRGILPGPRSPCPLPRHGHGQRHAHARAHPPACPHAHTHTHRVRADVAPGILNHEHLP